MAVLLVSIQLFLNAKLLMEQLFNRGRRLPALVIRGHPKRVVEIARGERRDVPGFFAGLLDQT
jgi:hypothetical protein